MQNANVILGQYRAVLAAAEQMLGLAKRNAWGDVSKTAIAIGGMTGRLKSIDPEALPDEDSRNERLRPSSCRPRLALTLGHHGPWACPVRSPLPRCQDGESSASISARVASARNIQTIRFEGKPELRVNADAEGRVLEEIATPDADGKSLLVRVAERFGLSARGYHRVLRVARTIADLDGGPDLIAGRHASGALLLRIRPSALLGELA